MPDNDKLHYSLGYRDALAYVLAETKHQKIKLPEIAEQYKKTFNEEHFSHEWHVSN